MYEFGHVIHRIQSYFLQMIQENSKLKDRIWRIYLISSQKQQLFNGTGFIAKYADSNDGQPEYIILTAGHVIKKVSPLSSQIQSSSYQQDSSLSKQNEQNEIPSQPSRQDYQQSSYQTERNQIPSAQSSRNDNQLSASQIKLSQIAPGSPNSQDNQQSSSQSKLSQILSGQPNSQDNQSSLSHSNLFSRQKKDIKLINHNQFSINLFQFQINKGQIKATQQQKRQNKQFTLEELKNDYAFINKQHFDLEILKQIHSSGGFQLPKQNLTYEDLNVKLSQARSELFLIGYNDNNQQTTTTYKIRLLTQQEIKKYPSLKQYSQYFFFYRVIQGNMCQDGVSGGPIYYNSYNPCAIAIHIGINSKRSDGNIYCGLKISQQKTININKKDSPLAITLNQVKSQNIINQINIQDQEYQQSQESNGLIKMYEYRNNVLKKQIMQNIQQDFLQQSQQNDETKFPKIIYQKQFKNCFFQTQQICFEKMNRQWKREIQIKIYQNTQQQPKHILQYQFYCGMKKAKVKHFRLPLAHKPEQKILVTDSSNILISFRQQITCNKIVAPQQTFILNSNPFIIFEDNNKQIPYQIQLGNGEIKIKIQAQITFI